MTRRSGTRSPDGKFSHLISKISKRLPCGMSHLAPTEGRLSAHSPTIRSRFGTPTTDEFAAFSGAIPLPSGRRVQSR